MSILINTLLQIFTNTDIVDNTRRSCVMRQGLSTGSENVIFSPHLSSFFKYQPNPEQPDYPHHHTSPPFSAADDNLLATVVGRLAAFENDATSSDKMSLQTSN